MSLQDVEGVTDREAINGYGIMADSGPEVGTDHPLDLHPCDSRCLITNLNCLLSLFFLW